MGRQRDSLVPVADTLADLGGPVKVTMVRPGPPWESPSPGVPGSNRDRGRALGRDPRTGSEVR